MVKGKRFIYAKAFDGVPTDENFRLEEYELGSPKDGEILCQAVHLSVDPYIRTLMTRLPDHRTMICRQIAKVIESKHPKFPVGSHVFGQFGWQTHTLVAPEERSTVLPKDAIDPVPYTLPDFEGLPLSLALGYLGFPGITGYFGFLDICQPKAGETVVVNAAAGTVGSLVGQIAKIKGCKVIGYAGSDEKCEYITKELGFDHAFNYKTVDLEKSLKEAAPEGVDCYYDNVGGQMSTVVMYHMRQRGRIAVGGSISAYNAKLDDFPKATIVQQAMINSQIRMEGLMVYRWADRYQDARQQIMQWIKEGKIRYRETVTEGFENMPKAFFGLFTGSNIGKAVVNV